MRVDDPREWIPHRPPILAVDAVDVAEPGVRGVGTRLFTAAEPLLAGHFPGRPVVPGVALIEGMAQTAAIVLLAKEGRGGGGFLADVSKFRFRRPLIPPVTVTFEVEVLGVFGGLCKIRGVARSGDGIAAEGEIVISAEGRA
ncbi:MAG: beta-hydroxyacyl-ACP dehydratase [Candidatus Brocadiae bacterium]|nr:beta-hydroxyacyl-ACP dehydratase [Candidatus Brocadiia bacterium]